MAIKQQVPPEAYETLKSNPDALYVDVRTEGEFAAGHPADAINIPVMVARGPGQMQLNIDFVEVAEKNGPYGAKAAGEISAMTAAPAILNAIYDAVGVRMFEVPASPDKVLKALQNKCQVARKAAGA